MLNAIIVFFESLWCKHLKHFWSKIRWCRKRKEKSREVVTVDDAGLYPLLKDIYAHFEWTMDDWTELFDSFTPAPYLYNLYDEAKKNENVVLDDCDGYHTIIYHILKNNGYNVALITCVTKPITKSHTMCLIKDDNGTYRVINYTRVYRYPSIEKFIENYSTPVRFWCLDRYDYDKNVFYSIEPEEM